MFFELPEKSWIIRAMTGNYLTTAGRGIAANLEMAARRRDWAGLN